MSTTFGERQTVDAARLFARAGGTTYRGLSGVVAFYAAATSGGAVTVLHTVTVRHGIVTSWSTSSPSGVPGEWQFNDAINSGQLLPIGII